MALGNKVMARRIRKKGGSLWGMRVLVLITIGAKTGARRETPVAWFPGPDGTWHLAASAAGAAHNPGWYHNLAAHPDQVSIVVDGEEIPVTATQLHGQEREQAWSEIKAAGGRWTDYESKTDRVIPIIRLARR